jgi:hypothetical protein
MSIRLSLVAGLVVAIGSAGCATVSEKASRIQLHSQQSNAISGCKRLAPLTVKESRFKPQAFDILGIKLREAAADAGADSVVMLGSEETLTDLVVQGVAYKCF